MNWFKKIIDILGFTNEEENIENHKDHFMQQKDSQADSKPNVVYRYPNQGQFRFPVIPDGESNIEKRENFRQKNNSYTKQPDVKKQNETKAHRFSPTSVPSPIHGYKSPIPINKEDKEDQQDQKIVSFERTNTDKETSLNTFEDKRGSAVEFQGNEEVINNHIDIEPEPTEQEERIQTKAIKEEQSFSKVLDQPEEMQEHNFEEPQAIQEEEKPIFNNREETNPHNGFIDIHEIANNEIQHQQLLEEQKQTPEEGENDLNFHTDYEEDYKEEAEELTHEVDEQQHVPAQPVVKKSNSVPSANERIKSISSSLNNHGIPYNVLMLKKAKNQPQPPVQPKKQEEKKELSLGLLDPPVLDSNQDDAWVEEQKETLNTTLHNFNVKAKVVAATKGPSVTRYEVQPDPGVKVSKITNLIDDIKLSMAAKDIRIEAPIPGKTAIGIEVPNKVRQSVSLKQIIESPAFNENKSLLTVSLGLDIEGNPIVTDIKKMPHGLIAGATGSGKSVCINSIILSLLYKASPEQVKLLLVDPKMVELAPYNNIPHLVSPVITDVKAATAALKWAVTEMDRRYEVFARVGVRDIEKYHSKIVEKEQTDDKMPYLVIVIDELADLMMVSPQDVEECICRIAQKARACGIHLIVATQRPSVDVITGLIKANIPTRIAFSVSSQADSRTIIDMGGAEKLLGKGDMLILENGSSKTERIQGNFVSDDEIERVTEEIRKLGEPDYLFHQEELIKQSYEMESEDELYTDACEFVIDQKGASASSLQRRFHIGYNRAARLIDSMESQGIISEQRGSKPREVLLSKEQYENNEEIIG